MHCVVHEMMGSRVRGRNSTQTLDKRAYPHLGPSTLCHFQLNPSASWMLKRFFSYITVVNLRQEEWIRNPPSYYCSEPITLLIGLHYIVKNHLNYFFNSTWLIIHGWFQNTLSTFSLTQTHYGEKSPDDFKAVAWLPHPPWGLWDESPFSQV